MDVLRRLGNRALVVSLTPATGRLDTLTAPAQISAWTATRNGQVLSWREDRNTKTNYEGGATNESRMMMRRVGGGTADSARVLFASMRGVTMSQAEDGERYAFARDGAIYVASLSDTTPRRLIGPAPRARGDSGRAGAATRDSSATAREERFTLVRMAPTGDAVVVSSRTGLHLVTAADGARRTISTITDTLRGPRVTLADWSADGRTLLLSRASRTTWDRGLLRVNVATGAVDTLVRDGRLYVARGCLPMGRVWR